MKPRTAEWWTVAVFFALIFGVILIAKVATEIRALPTLPGQ